MTIELITKEQYNTLLKIQKENEILTFQNEGYQYIDKSKFTDENQKAFDVTTSILQKSIKGFSEFNHFKLSKKTKEIQIRFQYDYSADQDSVYFIGVGYILLDELLNGFR